MLQNIVSNVNYSCDFLQIEVVGGHHTARCRGFSAGRGREAAVHEARKEDPAVILSHWERVGVRVPLVVGPNLSPARVALAQPPPLPCPHRPINSTCFRPFARGMF